MSNLLERAIVDATALKDAALRNAEQLVIEKYSLEVKQAMNQLLEQEEADAMADLFGDTEGLDSPKDPLDTEVPETDAEEEPTITTDDIESQIPDAFNSDEDEIIQIKLDSLDDEIEDEEEGPFAGDDELSDDEIGIDIQDDDLEADLDLDTDLDADVDMGGDIGIDVADDSPISAAALEEMIADALQDVLSEGEKGTKCDPTRGVDADPREKRRKGTYDAKGKCVPDPVQEENELDEEIDLDELMERVRVEGEPQKSGWAGTPESIMKEYEAMLLAREQDSEVKEENEELRKNVAALQKENKTLTSAARKLQMQTEKYETAFNTLQEKLETMNVSNAKLLYINQALENASLNERQKRKIVEAISKADTVQEAKIVFDTMSDAVSTTLDVKRDSTLNEVVSRKSSLLVAARKEQPKKDANPLFNRMQTLAGIKTQ